MATCYWAVDVALLAASAVLAVVVVAAIVLVVVVVPGLVVVDIVAVCGTSICPSSFYSCVGDRACWDFGP